MMEKAYIQKLLDSYMAAETTKEEERLLSDYFCTHQDIPAEWRNFSIMFRGMRQYEQKPEASSMKTLLKWSAVAAVVLFVFGTGALLMQQEETSKPSSPVAQIVIEEPAVNDLDSKQETFMKEKPIAVEKKLTRLAKSTCSVRSDKSVIRKEQMQKEQMQKEQMQKEKNVQHINKMLEDADLAFSLATVQCSMDIDESFLQDEKKEETEDETNIFL